MKPLPKSLLHAAGFLALLAALYFLCGIIDIPKRTGGILGDYGHQLLLDIGIAITLAVSLNLILGLAGQFSLGHAGFVAAGAFTGVLIAGRYFEPLLRFLTQNPLHFSTVTGFNLILLLGALVGAAVAAVLGLLVGLPTLRLRGDYLAIATLGFGEILAVFLQNFTLNDRAFFGGSTGLSLVGMRGEWLSNQPDADPLAVAVATYSDQVFHYVGAFPVFALALLTVYIVRNIKYATSGRALLALREDAVASEAVGVPTTRYKVAAFVIGAALAGLAGGLVSHHKSINPESFRFMRSIEIVAMVILGGQGSITGTIVAAIILTWLPEGLRSYLDIDKWRMVLYSLCIILAMLFRPQGLFGRYEITDLARWLCRLLRRARQTPAPAPGSQSPCLQSPAQDEPTPGPATLVTEPAADLEIEAAQRPTIENRKPKIENLLDVHHLTMQFGGLRAVDDFSLALLPGELVGLIGPNGAGKTTVFNALTGVYRPTAGTIAVAHANGQKSLLGLKPHSISHLGIARTFQNIRLFANLSVLDNVQIAQHAHHRQGIAAAVLRTPAFFREEEESRRRALGYLDLFNLAHLAHERASSLSYGSQRRLEIARALATRPRLLLLDEPAAGMNPTEKRELMELILSLRPRFGLTVLLIEHDMRVIMGVCQRILVLDYGKTIAQGTPEEIRRNPAVIQAYLGAPSKQE